MLLIFKFSICIVTLKMNSDNNEMENMYEQIDVFNDELNRKPKIIILNKLNYLRYQRIHQIILLRKIKKKIKKLKDTLKLMKILWITVAFENRDMTIQEFDSEILPISEHMKKTEHNLAESESMLEIEKIKMNHINDSYRDTQLFLENNFYDY